VNPYQSAQVVQCIREIGSGGGVSGVAHALENSLRRKGIDVQSFTLANVGVTRSGTAHRSLVLKKAIHLLDVVYFSLVGTLAARMQLDYKKVICHNDIVFGSIFVNHGLHRAMLDMSGRKMRMLARNPVHLFVLAREAIRFSLDVHSHYVCFAESEKNLLIRYYPKTKMKVRIIPNGVNLDRFKPDPVRRVEFRQRLEVPDDAFVITFIGHEFERKGLYAAVESLKYLDASCRLLVAGGTNEEIGRGEACAAKHGVRDRVAFLGVVQEIEGVLAASDCLVLPSIFEAWTLVGLEAMACGVPALLTRVCGVPLRDGAHGFFITRDPVDIAAQVNKLRFDPALLTVMRRQCIDFAARYSWDAIADQYLELIHAA